MRALHSLQHRRSKMSVKKFKGVFGSLQTVNSWAKAVTRDEVYEQILMTAKKGHERQWVPQDLFEPSDLENFNDIALTLAAGSNTEINLKELFTVLAQVYQPQILLIAAARSGLTALLHAHARFPFSKPILLTRDALFRATMLLTDYGVRFFAHSHVEICPKRDENARLKTIFIALAAPDAGAGIVDHESVVQVLTRLPYLMPSSEKKMPRKPGGGWKSVAKRLDPSPATQEVESLTIHGKDLQPLLSLVSELLGIQLHEGVEKGIAGDAKIDMKQFLIWGERKMRLLEGLAKFFEVLFRLTTKR